MWRLRTNKMKKKSLFIAIAGIVTIVACGPSDKEKEAKEKGKSDSLSAVNQFESESISSNKMFSSNSLKAFIPSDEMVNELSKLGDTLSKTNKQEFNYPDGFTSYFDNSDAFKEDLPGAQGEIIELVNVDTAGKAVFFRAIKSAQTRGLKLTPQTPQKANATSISYNIKSKSMIGFILGNAQMETDEAYNFIYKEDLYCDIPDSSFNKTTMNEVWNNAKDDVEKSKLYIIKEAWVISYITSKYKMKKFFANANIPDQGGAIKIGTDIYTGSNNKTVVYKVKFFALPLKNFITTDAKSTPAPAHT